MFRRVAILAAAVASVGTAQAAPADPSGTWVTQDGRARIRVETCGAGNTRACGYIVWLQKPVVDGAARKDAYNPDDAKKARPVLGLQLLEGLKPNGDDHYEGEIYNADNGKKYSVTLWTEEPGVLSVKGCLVYPLCSTQSWKRVGDVAPGQLAGAAGAPNGPRPEPAWARPGQVVGQPTASASARKVGKPPVPAQKPSTAPGAPAPAVEPED